MNNELFDANVVCCSCHDRYVSTICIEFIDNIGCQIFLPIFHTFHIAVSHYYFFMYNKLVEFS